MNEEKIATYFLKLDSVYREEIILQTKMNSNYSLEAREKLIQAISNQENLVHAKYYYPAELENYIKNKKWKNICSIPEGFLGRVCYEEDNIETLVGIIPIFIERDLLGYFVKKAKTENFTFLIQKSVTLNIFLIMLGAFSAIVFVVLLYFKKTVDNDLTYLVSFMNKNNLGDFKKNNMQTKEFDIIKNAIAQSWDMVSKFEREKSELQSKNLLINTARQVAHDIRSPLAALQVMSQYLSELPEEKRVLIRSAVQRINDIANDLGA